VVSTGDDERAPRRHRRREAGAGDGRDGAGKVAFVLSGGGNLGALQVGMLKALLGHGIVPDLVVGCSVGAINGAGLADDPSPAGVAHMERVWTALEGQNLLPSGWLPNAVALARKGEAVHDQAGLRAMAEEQLRSTTFDQLAVPFQCVATDILGVREVWFSEGPIVDAILASSALPAIYPAVEVGGVRYLDGGIVDDVPMSRAVELGATTLYVLQVGGFTRPRPEPQRPLDVAVQAYWIARHHRFKRELAAMPEGIEVHVLPAGETPRMRFNDFTQAGTLIDVAHAATARYLDDRAAGLPIPPLDEALASVEPGYEPTPPVAIDPGPSEGRWRRLTTARHRTADTPSPLDPATEDDTEVDPAAPVGDPAAAAAALAVPVLADEGNDHRRVAEMRQSLRDRMARSRHRRDADADAVMLDVSRWRRAVMARRAAGTAVPGTPPAAPGPPSRTSPSAPRGGLRTNGTTANGATTNGTTANSATPNGTTGNGTTANGATGNGASGGGASANGAGAGAAADRAATPGPAPTSTNDRAAGADRGPDPHGTANGNGNGHRVGARVARLLNRGDDA
jgi:NTE family protein